MKVGSTIFLAVCAGFAALTVACGSSTAPPEREPVSRHDLQRHDLSTPGRETLQTRVDFRPGAQAARHKHPGEEIIYVLRPFIPLFSESDSNTGGVMVGNRRGVASRAALLEAGRAAFSAQRYDEVSIVDVARSLGVAAGSISYHFGGKRGFYLAVVEQAAEEFWSDLIQMRGPALERLSDGIGKFLDRAQQEPRAFEALLADVADAEVRRIREQHRQRLAHALAVEITGTESTPVLRAAISGSLSFMEGIVLHWMHTDEVSRDAIRDLITANFIGTILSAVRSDPDIELSQRVIEAVLPDAQLLSVFADLASLIPVTNNTQ